MKIMSTPVLCPVHVPELNKSQTQIQLTLSQSGPNCPLRSLITVEGVAVVVLGHL